MTTEEKLDRILEYYREGKNNSDDQQKIINDIFNGNVEDFRKHDAQLRTDKFIAPNNQINGEGLMYLARGGYSGEFKTAKKMEELSIRVAESTIKINGKLEEVNDKMITYNLWSVIFTLVIAISTVISLCVTIKSCKLQQQQPTQQGLQELSKQP